MTGLILIDNEADYRPDTAVLEDRRNSPPARGVALLRLLRDVEHRRALASHTGFTGTVTDHPVPWPSTPEALRCAEAFREDAARRKRAALRAVREALHSIADTRVECLAADYLDFPEVGLFGSGYRGWVVDVAPLRDRRGFSLHCMVSVGSTTPELHQTYAQVQVPLPDAHPLASKR